MKISGEGPLLKLLLEFNKENGSTSVPSGKISMENLSKEVEQVLLNRDEVILRGETGLKLKIEFTRQLHEAPEAYLHRISSEMIKMKELENSKLGEQKIMLNLNNEAVDKAIKFGLLKELINHKSKENESLSSYPKENRWLLIFSSVFIGLLIIYLLFLK